MVRSLVEPHITQLVERLVPDEWWSPFRRVAPPTEALRPQGGGRRRAGERECLAAIIFVATSGCIWRQSPPVFGPAWPNAYRRSGRNQPSDVVGGGVAARVAWPE
ncbi:MULTISPECIES: transposase [unclassified Streptomyces]|uniref:transposase n=1 Tax=unclassified Streptomyces TaxID=2593676 RepID=UPI001C2F0B15|nr:transposase [Streptomyces sp. NBC_01601]MBV1949189.1 transposase [Streptomyces sp. BV129]